MTSQPNGKINSQKKALLIVAAITVSLAALSVICFLAYVGFFVMGIILKAVMGIIFALATLALIIYVIAKLKSKKKAS